MKISSSSVHLHLFFFLSLLLQLSNGDAYAQQAYPLYHGVKIFRIGSDTIIIHHETDQEKIDRPVFSHKSRDLYFEADTAFQPTSILYSYILSGRLSILQVPTFYPIKEYANLPHGHYRFQVKGKAGEQDFKILDYSFEILPPFYLTPFAFVVYIFFLFLLFLTILHSRNYQFAKQRYQLEKLINERTYELLKEKDRTEDLLANVLPKGTAEEIKSTGKVKKQRFQMATVLFSDIQGFTKIAEDMNPEILIDELDKFFFHFDLVVEKYNIEKIKTIGDAYMCAGGIPEKNSTNPVEVVLAALEMQQYMVKLKRELASKHNQVWDIRIGIHTGPVVAGVVGHKKLSYDIWGDTVNTASRMESSGEAGKINISGSTYELVKDYYICEYRGKMPVKYKGEIDMYFVNGIRPELSLGKVSIPGDKFFIKLQLLRIQDLENLVIQKLEEGLPPALTFHNVKHTISVYTMVELLGRAEQVSDEEMLLLRTAALLHDIGYLAKTGNQYEASGDFAYDLLPKYNYSDEQIKEVCRLMAAAHKPFEAEDLLTKIMCDANYNFLGRVDFIDAASRLWTEEVSRNPELNFLTWKKGMSTLLKKYSFHTKTAKALRDVNRDIQLKLIEEMER